MLKQLGLICSFFAIGLGCSAMAGNNLFLSSGQGNGQESEQQTELPGPADAKEQAPDLFQVKFETTKGDILVEVHREWSPNGADRFYNLVKIGYFKDIVIFRAIPGFMFQFGIHGDPKVNKVWGDATIKDDPAANVSNTTGMITYAKTDAPNSRSVQFFINLRNNAGLDRQGFTPFGKVVEGLDIMKQINTEYEENDPEDQGSFEAKGNEYILKKYPNLDRIKSVKLVEAEK